MEKENVKYIAIHLPAYPEGVSKEIDVKLKFTILADGTVGRILPLIKADTRLELAAINSLRQWRFEPLPENRNAWATNSSYYFPFPTSVVIIPLSKSCKRKFHNS